MADSMVKEILRSRSRGKRRLKLRKPPRWLMPDQQERAYRAYLFTVVEAVRAAFRSHVKPRLPILAMEAAALRPATDATDSMHLRKDGWDDDLDRAMAGLKGSLENAGKKFESRAGLFGKEVAAWNNKEFKKVVRVSLGIDVFQREPWLAPELSAWAKENASLITSLEGNAIKEVETMTARGLRTGLRHEEIAKDIEDRFDVSRSKAKMIARDQVSKLNGDLTQRRQTQIGITSYIWRTTGDDRVRETHMAHDGKTFQWNDPPADTGHPGDDFQCIPGTAMVSLNSLAKKAIRRWYRGQMTALVTDSGESVDCTGNHPVLTQRGWLPAHLVQVGDYLIQAPGESFDLIVNDPERGYANAEQVFRSLAEVAFTHRISGRASWFHGDGINQQIDVVDVDGSLSNGVESAVEKKFRDDRLTLADSPALGERDVATPPLGSWTSGSLVSGAGASRSLVGGGLGHSREHSRAPISGHNTVIGEYAPNSIPCYFEAGGDSLLAHAVSIKSDDLRLRKVSEIMRTEFDGWVYNFETISGWYSCHGLIIHNCRCTAEPVLAGLLEGLAGLEEEEE